MEAPARCRALGVSFLFIYFFISSLLLCCTPGEVREAESVPPPLGCRKLPLSQYIHAYGDGAGLPPPPPPPPQPLPPRWVSAFQLRGARGGHPQQPQRRGRVKLCGKVARAPTPPLRPRTAPTAAPQPSRSGAQRSASPCPAPPALQRSAPSLPPHFAFKLQLLRLNLLCRSSISSHVAVNCG